METHPASLIVANMCELNALKFIHNWHKKKVPTIFNTHSQYAKNVHSCNTRYASNANLFKAYYRANASEQTVSAVAVAVAVISNPI